MYVSSWMVQHTGRTCICLLWLADVSQETDKSASSLLALVVSDATSDWSMLAGEWLAVCGVCRSFAVLLTSTNGDQDHKPRTLTLV